MSDQATSRQTWAIFCACGQDVREWNLTYDDASDILDKLSNRERVEFEGVTLIPKKKSEDWRELFDKADEAGKEAARNHNPTPMVVQERLNPLDDTSPVVKEYEPIADGVCGFAWVNFRPGTHGFCRWLKKNTNARKAYYGGIELWIHDYNQSMEKKYAYAQAFAKVINDEISDEKFHASAGCKMD